MYIITLLFSLFPILFNATIVSCVFVYVTVWFAVVFGIISASDAGRKIIAAMQALLHFLYLYCEHY